MMPPRAKLPWIQHLYDVLSASPWQRKGLVCSSFAEGHMLIERIARECGPVVNVEIKTVDALVLDVVRLTLEKRGITLIPDETLMWVVQSLLSTVADSFPNVIDRASLSPGTIRVFHHAVMELREHGVVSSELEPMQFVNVEKGTLLARLLAGVEVYLADRNQTDMAGALQMALDPALSWHLPYLTLIIPSSLEVQGLRNLFLTMLQSRIETIQVMDTDVSATYPFEGPRTMKLFSAAGSVAEAREVLRRAIATGFPFDEIEIATSGSDEEMLAIYSQAARLGIHATFSQGLPGDFTRNGQLATAYLNWLESNFDVNTLLGALREGVLRIADSDSSVYELSRCLEEANIGWGRNRYLPILRKHADAGGETAPHYRALHTLCENLFQHLPTENHSDWTIQSILTSLDSTVQSYGSTYDEDELMVLAKIRDMKRTISSVDTPTMSLKMAIEYIRDLLGQIRVNISERPAPGAIHVSTWQNGGICGRKITFVTGLSERNWSVQVVQHPILLDVEKSHIGHGLLLSDEHAKRTLANRLRIFHVASENITLSYSGYDVVDNKPEPPASALLQAFRESSGETNADYSALMQALGQPVGYSVAGETNHATPRLDAADGWISNMVDAEGRVKQAKSVILSAYPALQAGQTAEDARGTEDFTVYDGYVGGQSTPEVQMDDATNASVTKRSYVSTSALETLATCPRKYFYKYALRLSPEEVTEFDRNQWLSPLERGSLLHEVFELYMSAVTDGGTRSAVHDETLLIQICEEVIERYREDIPAPSTHILDLECQQIRDSMPKFLSMERNRDGIPRYFELEIGSREEPFMVDLGDGVQLPLSAVVDRIDEVTDNTYRILDYKTGRSSRYHETEPFKGGRQLQHAVYAMAVEQWFAKHGGNPSARVTDSAYVFPTLRARDSEVPFREDSEMRENLRNLVSRLLGVIDKGVFPATSDKVRCQWCDFLAVCTEQASVNAKEKYENPNNRAILSDLLEVEDYA